MPRINTQEMDRGFEFADRLTQLVAEFGPVELSQAERDALGSHLISSAVDWVRYRNRINKASAK